MAIANAVMAGCARPKSPFLHPGPTRTKVAPSDTLPHRQKTAAKLAQLCFTCIGFPLGLLLGFSFGLGVQGFVAGQAAGLAGLAQDRGEGGSSDRQERTMILSRFLCAGRVLYTAAVMSILARTDWSTQCTLASERVTRLKQ